MISICKTILSCQGWTLPVSTQAGLQDAVTVIRTVLLNAAAP